MKNGFSKIALALVALVAVTSCSKEADSNLTLDFVDRPVLIPNDTASCSQILPTIGTESTPASDIQGKYFSMRNPVVYWSDLEDSVHVVYVKVEIKSALLSNGNYQCLISEDELSNVYAGITMLTDDQTGLPKPFISKWNMDLGPATKGGDGKTVPSKVTTNAACKFLRCGGLRFVAGKDRPTELTGTITIFGVATKASDQSEYPVKTVGSITVVNDI